MTHPYVLKFCWLMACFFLPAACRVGTAKAQKIPCRGEKSAVEEVVRNLIEADNSRDMKAALSAYTEDVVWLPPSGETVRGKPAIESRYRDLYKSYRPGIQLDIEESGVSGSLAFVRGRNRGMLVAIDGGQNRQLNDKFMALLRCRKGTWKISHLMWSPL